MTIEEAEVYIDQIAKDPFELDFKDDEDFEKFLLIEPDVPGVHKKSIVNLLDMILAKGGDHEKEMVIYKVLANFHE